MHSLSIRPAAKNDIQDIVDYYDNLSPKLTDNFLNELDTCIEDIRKMPKAYQKRFHEIRVIFLKRFPFGVFYKMYGKKVVVIAVLHTSRNPEIWKKR
ncbi:MAG: type II toxin-antitoxin system RelE/ParE family toxin [Chlorobi bacterium]|nr:type II toxin-antitoxin system RelE/ParE family toxin [Chlorobiota bacterium]